MTPTEIAELSEDDARALFRRYRFAENGGEPCCNHCGSPAAWTYRDGKLFKCKQCLRQFTPTTNTPFAYRKLPFKTILLILAQFNIAYQARSAREIRRDLRAKVKNYKTIFVWLHKIRSAMQALSVAALLAASTTFGWSRWRGLLLDDPLQHNDVIHASAFMDLLRQMVRELGYQVILSTHDSSEAEFLGRKCRSAGIPYHVHELVPQGEGGLISNVA